MYEGESPMLKRMEDDEFILKVLYWKSRFLRATDQLAADAADFGMNDLSDLLLSIGNDLRISMIRDEQDLVQKNSPRGPSEHSIEDFISDKENI